MCSQDKEKFCVRCKKTYIAEENIRSNPYCPECRSELYSNKRYNDFEERPLTPDTEMLVCHYHIENYTVSQISDLLRRPVEQISEIIYKAKCSGAYEAHRRTMLR